MPIFDASSVQAALRKLRGDAAPILDGQTVLDLTLYELGNIVWKENRASGGEPREATEKVKAIVRLISIMDIWRIDPGEMAAIAENASRYGLTFYDSAYLTAALKAGAHLVTEDTDILRAANKAGLTASQIEQYLKTLS
ncbi:MAG TPA: type II toxin-antitoxin system VapC family toxin [Candidatus Desulfaltia sp.]|nr:type II toxin-antitoxin system VapC family toxin [Candidatus Desulfaltia sp.]